MRERVVRMDLNGQRLFREQQLEQQSLGLALSHRSGETKVRRSRRRQAGYRSMARGRCSPRACSQPACRHARSPRRSPVRRGWRRHMPGESRFRATCPIIAGSKPSGRIAKRLQAFKTRAASCGASRTPGTWFSLFSPGSVIPFVQESRDHSPACRRLGELTDSRGIVEEFSLQLRRQRTPLQDHCRPEAAQHEILIIRDGEVRGG